MQSRPPTHPGAAPLPNAADETKAKRIAELSKAIELDPQNVDAYCERASLWGEANDFDKAIADLTKAILRDPSPAWIYGHRALMWLGKGDYDRAIADSTKRLELALAEPGH